MAHLFGHEKLKVYQKGMDFVAIRSALLDELPRRVAACDHLDRGAESILINIAHASSSWSPKERIVYLGHANGSALECAACLDVFIAKGLLANHDVYPGKSLLASHTKQQSSRHHLWIWQRPIVPRILPGWKKDANCCDVSRQCSHPCQRSHPMTLTSTLSPTLGRLRLVAPPSRWRRFTCTYQRPMSIEEPKAGVEP
jgi:four helix bundle protein